MMTPDHERAYTPASAFAPSIFSTLSTARPPRADEERPTRNRGRGEADWFDSSLGRSLLEQERRHCRGLVPSGYYPRSLQAGRATVDFLAGLETGSRFFIGELAPQADTAADTDAASYTPPTLYAIAKSSAMPFADKTHNLIVLPHTLDFCDDPHSVLREVSHILAARGCVVIIGFNQWSLWGALGVLRKASAAGRYRRVGHVQDWLSLLGFELVGAAMLGYRPPLQSEKWRRKLKFIDKAGARWWPGLGAVYIIVGRKQEIAVRGRGAARLRWRQLLPGMAQPAAQNAAPLRASAPLQTPEKVR